MKNARPHNLFDSEIELGQFVELVLEFVLLLHCK